MKRIVITLVLLFTAIGLSGIYAQGWAKKLGRIAVESAKNKVEQKVGEKVEQEVGETIDDAYDSTFKKDKKAKQTKDSTTADETEDSNQEVSEGEAESASVGGEKSATNKKRTRKDAEMAWNKFDFVAGDEVIFSDDQASEQMGEFPSQWDVLSGSAEIININGEKAIEVINAGKIIPLMENPKTYLPDVFTIEFDVFLRDESMAESVTNGGNWINADWYFTLNKEDEPMFEFNASPFYPAAEDGLSEHSISFNYTWKASGENRGGETQGIKIALEEWHHISISFNKRALKLYFDQTRLINIPNMEKPGWFQIQADEAKAKVYFIKNVRIAKGAVPLYDRMMSDGKFITYGITFDVGKSTIKPESMGEINRIVKLMTDNPELKFSVEGHTDSTGSLAANQTLSEKRSQAIVDKLVEMGISSSRLNASGKGQSNPIADNTTDEGRAKNRRVEFVKM